MSLQRFGVSSSRPNLVGLILLLLLAGHLGNLLALLNFPILWISLWRWGLITRLLRFLLLLNVVLSLKVLLLHLCEIDHIRDRVVGKDGTGRRGLSYI
jgi:hypothetical protein